MGVGMAAAEGGMAPPPSGGSMEAAAVAPEIRKDFPETWIWHDIYSYDAGLVLCIKIWSDLCFLMCASSSIDVFFLLCFIFSLVWFRIK